MGHVFGRGPPFPLWRCALRQWLREYAADVLALTGAVSVVRGVALYSPPLAWVVGGVLLLAAAHLARRLETPTIPTGDPGPS